MRAAVLWSGGKESSLACQRVMAIGHDVAMLVTFVLDGWPYQCHPHSIMSQQSEALGIPHVTLKVEEPYRETYRSAISRLIRTEAIRGIVTGDIRELPDHERWIESVCEGLDVEVIMPLWNAEPSEVLDAVIAQGFKPVFTCVRQPWFNEDWLGRELDSKCVKELNALHDRFKIDPCGENGEYHTMVLDGPMFRQSIKIDEFRKEMKNSLLSLRVDRCSLQSKQQREQD